MESPLSHCVLGTVVPDHFAVTPDHCASVATDVLATAATDVLASVAPELFATVAVEWIESKPVTFQRLVG